MGLSNSKDDSKASLKLQAQSVSAFDGSYDDWSVWKSRTECAFSGSGYDKVLDSKEYAASNKGENKIVYSQLAVATVDGTAYHLVKKHDVSKDGYKAWKDLCQWYNGEEFCTEAVESA